MFRGFLRCSRPARSIARVNISYTQSSNDHPTPPELRGRFIWRLAAPKSVISRVPKWVAWWCVMVMAYTKFQNLEGFYWISRSSSVRYGSYSTVSKFSPVLSNCKVWTESDHWWWRYLMFKISHPINLCQPMNPDLATSKLGLTWTQPDLKLTKTITNSISITNVPIRFILCSSIILVSTSKLQNMNRNGHFRRFPQVGTSHVTKIQKKLTFEKSYLDHF